MDAYTALIGFAGWLTSRPEEITLSYFHDAAPIVELIGEWCTAQGIDTSVFNDSEIVPMPSDLDDKRLFDPCSRDIDSDMQVIANAFFQALIDNQRAHDCVGISPKRPFGNSNIGGDIAHMLNIAIDDPTGDSDFINDEINDYCNGLWEKLPLWLAKNK